ncbi:hypothetical protein ANN_20570, partial [Periplaneta americana]
LDTKIASIAAYGLDIIWEKLSFGPKDARSSQSRFLRATLAIWKLTKSKLAYELAKETFFIEYLRTPRKIYCWTE